MGRNNHPNSTRKTPPYKGLLKAIERLGRHDHLCLIYETREEQFAAVVPFMRIGLERGERCIYIADDNTSAQVLEAMAVGGIDTEGAIRSGALSVITKQEAYLKQGYFDPDWMINFLKETTDSAKAEGYSALRATGEMTWMLGGDAGSERLIEYESKLNYFFPEYDALAICQYNFKRFKPEIILDVIRTHPFVIYRGRVSRNSYYVPPDEMLLPNQPYLEVERYLYNIFERERVKELWSLTGEELQESELKLKETERIGKVGSWEWDLGTDMLTWSDGTYRIFGLVPGVPTPNYAEHLKLYTPESAERLKNVVDQALRTGEPFELDLELAGQAEPKRQLIARGEARRDAVGRIVRFFGTVIDITERNLAEAELKKVNAKLQEAMGKIKMLQGLLPMCASCRRIRNEKGNWEGLEHYLRTYIGAEFTHCVCPECAEKYWNELKSG